MDGESRIVDTERMQVYDVKQSCNVNLSKAFIKRTVELKSVLTTVVGERFVTDFWDDERCCGDLYHLDHW
ncbi:hypothetical protein HOLleu_44983 [Holothuria leucospilota]|uniref:Uncharacterized protein n=1 Tax=Holothuria leucospilota TaxID=206669 RepID=A0A9Q1BA59_HOLLE|nr:hypothetical protein HOLleu_44983 [Holothuria leucospilota]